MSLFKNKTLLITGGTGSFGKAFTKYVLENYCRKWGIRGNKWYKEDWNYDSLTMDLEKINELKSDMKTNEENLDKSIKTLTASYKRLHKVRTDTSNYKLYCKYFGEATPKEIVQRAKDEGLIDGIEGDIDLHNADVDTIITMYNTMYIKDMLDEIKSLE